MSQVSSSLYGSEAKVMGLVEVLSEHCCVCSSGMLGGTMTVGICVGG